MLPGWYRFGTAVSEYAAAKPKGMAMLQEMHARWPFFQAMLSNMEMVLAKCNIGIASRHAELVQDSRLRKTIFGRLRNEWQLSIEMLLADYQAEGAARSETAPRALDPESFSLSRSVEPPADRAFATPALRRRGRAHRHGIRLTIKGSDRPPQQRLSKCASWHRKRHCRKQWK